MGSITGKTIADLLDKPLQGESRIILNPADLAECGPGDLVWVKSYTPERLAALNNNAPSLVICDVETARRTQAPCVISENPRLDFIRVLNALFLPEQERTIHPSAAISPGATIGSDVSIGPNACIGPNVVIGDGCIIGAGVAIEGAVTLGKRCRIKANSAIGGQGFGFEYDENGVPLHFPHLGTIVIEDDVWIGACSTVEIASLGTTRLCEGCKIDDLVQVGHNSTVGRNTLVMANVVLCGGVVIGERCWIAPNSVIKQKVRIGEGVTVGLGSVVLKDVEDASVVAGVPATPLKPKS